MESRESRESRRMRKMRIRFFKYCFTLILHRFTRYIRELLVVSVSTRASAGLSSANTICADDGCDEYRCWFE